MRYLTSSLFDRARWRMSLHPGLLLWGFFFLWETVGVRGSLGAGFSLAGLLDDLALVVLFLGLYAALEMLPKGVRAVLGTVLAVAFGAFVLANALYFSFFRTFLNVDSVFLLNQVPDTSDSVWAIMTPALILSTLVVPAVLMILALLRSTGHGPRRSGVLVMVFAIVAVPSFAVSGLVRSRTFTTSQNSPLPHVARQGLDRVAGALLTDDEAMLARLGKDYEAIWNLEPGYRLGAQPGYPLLRIPAGPPPEGAGVRNVVLVLMESVRSWETGVDNDLPSVTPNLAGLAKEGLVFTPFYANGHQTVRGEVAVLCSAQPNTGGGQIYSRFPYAGLRCLPEILGDRGYATHWISSYTADYGNKSEFLIAHGIQQVHDKDEIERRKLRMPRVGWGASDEDLMDFALDVLDGSKEPFFAEIMTLSNHHPFNHGYNVARPQAYDTRGDPVVYRDYLHGIAYTDHAIGRFMEAAREKPWFEDTLFVFLGDHGQWHFPTRQRRPFPVQEVEVYFRLPLVFYAPGHLAPARREVVGSQIDVAPTILDLLGMAEPNAFVGVSLLADLPPEKRYAFMGYENGWSIRQDDAFCYTVGRTCFADSPPLCRAGEEPLPRPHACFRYDGDLLEATRADAGAFEPLPPDEAESLVNRGLRLMDAKAFLLRTDSFYPREAGGAVSSRE